VHHAKRTKRGGSPGQESARKTRFCPPTFKLVWKPHQIPGAGRRDLPGAACTTRVGPAGSGAPRDRRDHPSADPEGHRC